MIELGRAWLDFQDIAEATVLGGDEKAKSYDGLHWVNPEPQSACIIDPADFDVSRIKPEPAKDYANANVCTDASNEFYGWTRGSQKIDDVWHHGWKRELSGKCGVYFLTDLLQNFYSWNGIEGWIIPGDSRDKIFSYPKSYWANPMPEDPHDSEPEAPYQPGEAVQGATPVHEVVEPIRVKVKPTLGDASKIAMPAESAIKAVGRITNSRKLMGDAGNLSLPYVDSLRKWMATERQCQIGQLGHEGHTVTDLREMIKAHAVNGQLVIPK
jgi:hypothetical protein